jgi:PhnB protein
MSDHTVGPYINFGGRAREALEFYQGVLGGELAMYASDEKGTRPAEPGERIAHAVLTVGGVTITATDGHPSYPATVGDNMALTLGGTDADAIRQAFDSLASDGGNAKSKLMEQPWGATGYLVDKFGINWVVSIHKG